MQFYRRKEEMEIPIKCSISQVARCCGSLWAAEIGKISRGGAAGLNTVLSKPWNSPTDMFRDIRLIGLINDRSVNLPRSIIRFCLTIRRSSVDPLIPRFRHSCLLSSFLFFSTNPARIIFRIIGNTCHLEGPSIKQILTGVITEIMPLHFVNRLVCL